MHTRPQIVVLVPCLVRAMLIDVVVGSTGGKLQRHTVIGALQAR